MKLSNIIKENDDDDYVSNCCGADIMPGTGDLDDDLIGRCGDCKDMAQFEKESEFYGESLKEGDGNMEGYLATIDEYVEMLFKHSPEDMTPKFKNEIAYRIQNAVDDIRTRELGLKPSNIRSQYNEDWSDVKNAVKKGVKAFWHGGAKFDKKGVKFSSDLRKPKAVTNKPLMQSEEKVVEGPDYRLQAQRETMNLSDQAIVELVASLYKKLDELGHREETDAEYFDDLYKRHPNNEGCTKMKKKKLNEIDPSRSPWTQSGKHPGAMTRKELKAEIAVFDEIMARGDHLSPKEMMQLDSLWNYLEGDSMSEEIVKEANHITNKNRWITSRKK